MAPRYATLGQRLELKMAEQPALLRRLRLADGALLAALAVAFLATGSASAAQLSPAPTTDPSRAGSTLAWERLGGAGAVFVDGDARSELPAQTVAIGGRYVATRDGSTITVRDRASGAVVVERARRGRDAARRLESLAGVAHDPPGGGDRLWALPLPVAQAVPAQSRRAERRAHRRDRALVAGGARRESIDRPALSGDHLAYAATTRGGSAHRDRQPRDAQTPPGARARSGQLSQPSLDGGRLLYVQSSWCSQRLRVVRTSALRRPRTLLRIGTTARRDEGHEHDYTTQGSEPEPLPAWHARPHGHAPVDDRARRPRART